MFDSQETKRLRKGRLADWEMKETTVMALYQL